MKTLKFFGLVLLAIGSSDFANAGTVYSKDLKLDCHGEYKVLKAEPYYKPPMGRAPGRSGTHETVKVLSLDGPGCELLEPNYKIEIQIGDELPYGQSIYEGSFLEAKALASQRLGNTYPFSAEQHFGYQTKYGTLPFFPTLHQESLSILGKTRTLDAQKTYGSLTVSELADSDKTKLLKEAYSAIEYGKKYQSISADSDDFLGFILAVSFEKEDLVLQYIEDLILLFENTTRYTSSFVSLHPGTQIGAKLNELLNTYGKSKFSSKIEVLKRNPLLFEDQIVGWAFLKNGISVPKLTESETVDFLVTALEEAENLAKVPQVLEARYLLQQYKEAGKTILAYSNKQPPAMYKKHEYFVVNAEAESLIHSLLAVK